jgi:aryl-alcohol dehydrogenase-like predicted oxidoreductase
LAEALAVSRRERFARYIALQPHYNLVHRSEYEGELRDVCLREGLACFPYFALAKGFLTGKYRPGGHFESPRAPGASAYLNESGLRLLAALDDIAAAHHTTVAAVALAWLAAQPTVVAPIASARTIEQLADLLPVVDITLSPGELGRLSAA